MRNKLPGTVSAAYLLIFFGGVLISLFSESFSNLQLNPFDYARITDVDYKAVVADEPDSEGKVHITERLTFDVHAASRNNLYWELWRDLPEQYVDGVKVDYTVLSVKQILEDGTEIPYEESPRLYWDDYDYVSANPTYGPGKWYHSDGPYNKSLAMYECVLFYVDGLYREQVVFEIEYEMHNAALRYNDCSDLYLSLYSGDTVRYLDSFKAQILFPEEDMPAPGNYNVTTYGTNANSFPVSESADANPGYYTFSFELDKDQLRFRPYNEYIEFDLVSYGADKHVFTDYAPWNLYYYDDVLDEITADQQAYAEAPQRFRIQKSVIFLLCAAGAAAAAVYCFTLGPRIRRKYTFYEATVNTDYFRGVPGDLDPNFAAFLVYCKHRKAKDYPGVYSALLLSLARKGYVRLQEVSSKDIRISTAPSQQIPADLREPLSVCEAYYYNLLVRHASSGTILMSDFQSRVSMDRENTNTFTKNMKNSIAKIGKSQGYFQKGDYDEPQRTARSRAAFFLVCGIIAILANPAAYHTRLDLAFGGFFFLGIVCIAGSIFLWVKTRKYILLTQFGENEYAKWRGFYKFLKSEEFRQNDIITDSSAGEKYLVYAAAFGLSGKELEAIALKCPKETESPILHRGYYRPWLYRYYGRSFYSSAHSASHGGWGGFSSGGYGGGGRGGGGGGGGH